MKIRFMHEQDKIMHPYPFIPATGNAAEEIRNFSWEKTVLGLPETWPQVLKTTLSIILKINSPVCIAWGNDLFPFYNDAFAQLPGNHFRIGKSAVDALASGQQSCIRKALKGETFTATDFLPGTFEFSPLLAENDEAAGVLITAKRTEVAAKPEPESIFYDLMVQAPVGITILHGPKYMVEMANDIYLELVARKRSDFVGKPLFDALPELVGQGLEELLSGVLQNGISYTGSEFELMIERNGRKERSYFNFVYSPFRENNTISGIMVVATEVTELVKSRHILEESERQLRSMVMQSPVPVTIFRGKDYIIEMANEVMFTDIWQKNQEEVIGKKLLDVFPELAGQKYPELLGRVFKTGLPYSEKESIAIVEGNAGKNVFYLDYEYAPLFDDEKNVSGILVTVNDVSEKVLARKRIEESETRQKIAIESAEIGTFDWDIIRSQFIYSERLATIFGYRNTSELGHKSFSGLIHPDDAELRQKAHKDSFNTGMLSYEARFIKPDQSLCWLRLNGKVFFDENGFPLRMYGTVLDITHQKMQTDALEAKVEERTRELRSKHEELRQSEERYHRMTDEIQDYAFIMLDKDGTILNWNKGAQKIKGYSESEIIGKNFNIFYLPEDRQNKLPDRIIGEAARVGRAVHEGWRIRKDESIFWGSIVITALHDDEDNIIGFSKVTRDLTERKIAEDRMKQYAIELEFQNKELEQFAYVASHDLQEPLRKIQTFSSILQNNLDNRETAELYLGKVRSSAERMTQLIKAVLNYSKLSKMTVETEDVDLNELLENIEVDFELLISEKTARVIYRKLPHIKGYPLQLTQLFSNLIGNALKFTDKPSPEIWISHRYISGKEVMEYPNLQVGVRYLELVFSDNGIGFEKQYAKQIFDMFQRLHDKQSYSGTGIGLALCKRIVENHHGYITATSELGEGATFFIYIPV